MKHACPTIKQCICTPHTLYRKAILDECFVSCTSSMHMYMHTLRVLQQRTHKAYRPVLDALSRYRFVLAWDNAPLTQQKSSKTLHRGGYPQATSTV
jgi:hypothetical protein